MDKSLRINLIKNIANALSPEERSVIDLTLKQFSLPTYNTAVGNVHSYIISMIEDASDETILALAKHLKVDLIGIENMEPIEFPFWKKDYFRVFITHLSTHKIFASELRDALDKYAITAFVAHDDIHPSKEWQKEIELALKTTHSLVALMHEGFHESVWTDQEVGVCIGRDIVIIPVQIEEKPYGFMGKYQALKSANPDVNQLASHIYQSIASNNVSKKQYAFSLLSKFENCNTFLEAKETMLKIEELKYIDDSILERLKQAPINNNQIRDASRVPEKINSFLNRYVSKK